MAESALDTWYRTARQATWPNIAAVKMVYAHADAVGRCTVFNIHGNRYRLIAHLNYAYQTLHILGIYTHQEYNKGGWKHGC